MRKYGYESTQLGKSVLRYPNFKIKPTLGDQREKIEQENVIPESSFPAFLVAAYVPSVRIPTHSHYIHRQYDRVG